MIVWMAFFREKGKSHFLIETIFIRVSKSTKTPEQVNSVCCVLSSRSCIGYISFSGDCWPTFLTKLVWVIRSDGPQIFLRIAVQYQLCVCRRTIPNQAIQFRPLIQIIGLHIFHGSAVDGNNAPIRLLYIYPVHAHIIKCTIDIRFHIPFSFEFVR